MRADFETRPNLETRLGPVDWHAIEQAVARARRLRAEAFAEHAGRTARALAGWAARAIGAVARMRQRRADTRALMTLDDRLLADIGLSRTDIKAAVYNGAPLRAAQRDEGHGPAPIHRLATRQPAPSAPERHLDRAA